MDTVDNAITKPVHRLEVFTGAGRRRTWSEEDKARIVAECGFRFMPAGFSDLKPATVPI